jgi:hypothetical protein
MASKTTLSLHQGDEAQSGYSNPGALHTAPFRVDCCATAQLECRMNELEKPCVFFDSEADVPALLVGYPKKPLSLPELWDFVLRGLDGSTELEEFAKAHVCSTITCADPVWQPQQGLFTFALYWEATPDRYQSGTLEPSFSRQGVHLRLAGVTQKYIKLDGEENF